MISPIFAYELRRTARGGRMAWLRVAVGGLLIVTLYWLYRDQFPGSGLFDRAEMRPGLRPAQVGEEFASRCGLMLYLLAMLVTPPLMADAVAGERQRATLDSILTTTVSPGGYIWAVFLCRFLVIATILLTALPVLSISILIGGIAEERLMTWFMMVTGVVLSVSGLTLWASAKGGSVLNAVVSGYGGAVVVNLVTCCAFCCGYGMKMSLEIEGIEASDFEIVSVLIVPLIHCLVGAYGVLWAESWFDPYAAGAERNRPPPAGAALSNAESPQVKREPIGDRPWAWKEANAHSVLNKPELGVVMLAVMTVAVLFVILPILGTRPVNPENLFAVVLVGMVIGSMSACLTITASWHATNSLVSERERGSLPVLLTVPVERWQLLTVKGFGGLIGALPRGFACAFTAALVLTMAFGALHPVSGLILTFSIATTLVMVTGVGVLISATCRSTLWANMVMSVLVFAWIASAFAVADVLQHQAIVNKWPSRDWFHFAATAVLPPVTWARASLSWNDWANLSPTDFVSLWIGSPIMLAIGVACWGVAYWRFLGDDGGRD